MIDVAHSGGILWIKLNRPEKANAFTKAMLQELLDIVRAEIAAKAVVFIGAGKVFSAGADLDEADLGLAIDPIWEQLSESVAKMRGITICALNGTLAGGAFGLALACDLRISVPKARFFYPVLKKGFLPQPSDSKRMVQLIGPSRTKLILLAGQKISSDQALLFGLIDQIIPENMLEDEAEKLCADALSAISDTVFAIKEACNVARLSTSLGD